MTREEFDALMAKRGFGEMVISDDDYERIEKVYTYHPCISETDGKEQIVYLVGHFGMRIIRDMQDTAEMAYVLEQAIHETTNQLETYKEKLKDLKYGR